MAPEEFKALSTGKRYKITLNDRTKWAKDKNSWSNCRYCANPMKEGDSADFARVDRPNDGTIDIEIVLLHSHCFESALGDGIPTELHEPRIKSVAAQ